MVTIGGRTLKLILRLLFGNVGFFDDFLDLVETLLLVAFFTLEGESVNFANLSGDFRLKRLVRSGKDAKLDEIRHHVERLETQAGGKIRDENRRLDDDELGIVGFLRRILCGCFRGSGNRRFLSDHHVRILVLLFENLGNAANHLLAGRGFLTRLRLLLLGKKIEGVCLGRLHLAGCGGGFRFDFLTLPPGRLFDIVDEIEDFFRLV